MFYPFDILTIAGLALLPAFCLAIVHFTSNPYETRPTPDGYLTFQIIPVPQGVLIEKDVKVAMPDGVGLACNIYRPEKDGKFPVILGMTPYNKDQAPPAYNPDGSFLPTSYANYVQRLYTAGIGLGHQKISMLTAFEFADPAFWVPNDYAVLIADQRGGFKSEGTPPTNSQMADDLYALIEWAASQAWSNGNVGMIGVSALAHNQYWAASREVPPPHLKAICPWEGFSDRYRDATFWGGIPEANFFNRPLKARIQALPPDQQPDEAAKIWAAGIDPVANQSMLQNNPRLELITVPALVCATWTDKGLHTRGSFEVFRRIASREKWLYIHGGHKWDRFYGEDGTAYQKRFFDYYLKREQNGWQKQPRVRLEVRETRDEYEVYFENEFPLARTRYKKLYLDARDGSLGAKAEKTGKVGYNSTQGGSASFGITFDRETELTGYMKVKLWVSAKDADDMDLFVTVKKFAGPCDADTSICKSLERVMGHGRIARGNEIQFWGHDGFWSDVAARGQMRVSQRELDPVLSTAWQPVQKFQGGKKLKPGEIVPVEIALLPSSTLFRKGESLRLFIQGHCPTDHWVVFYDWLINKGSHVIHTGGRYDSYLQIPLVRR
jgi:predicted acyl esterase